MTSMPGPLTDDPYRGMYRRALTIVQRHSFPVHETSGALAPHGGVTYQRDGIHYVVMDVRAMFGEIVAQLVDALDPGRDDVRATLRAARDALLTLGSDEARRAADLPGVAAQIDRALARSAYDLGEARRGGIDGWRKAVDAKLERTTAIAEERAEDFWWGYASGLSEALSAHGAFVARGQGICVISDGRHAPLWRGWRERGEPIRSTWIDEIPEGAGSDPWRQRLAEATECGLAVLYVEAGDAVEDLLPVAGAALAAGRGLLLVGNASAGSLASHPLVRVEAGLPDAFAEARRVLGPPDAPPLPAWLLAARR